MSSSPLQPVSPWPHRMAVLLVCCTYPLIWVGGLVTSLKAGMAFPDWPTSGGYNMLAYPLDKWWSGPFDMFIEHGHRLFAVLVGLMTIGLVLVFWRKEPRTWVRWLALAALAAVALQGCIGGLRVVLDQRRVAMIHGCIGPAFFGFCVALAVFTSKRWRESTGTATSPQGTRLKRLAVTTAVLAYLQLVIGALVRHIPETAPPGEFQAVVIFHLLGAVLLAGHAIWLAALVLWRGYPSQGLRFTAWSLLTVVGIQIGLGLATWVAKYGFPGWFQQFSFPAQHCIVANGPWQYGLATAHMATGSLLLAGSVVFAIRAVRFLRPLTTAEAKLAESSAAQITDARKTDAQIVTGNSQSARREPSSPRPGVKRAVSLAEAATL